MSLATITVRDGDSSKQNFPVHKGAGGETIPVCSSDTGKPQFRYAGTFTPYATSAVVLANIKGSATKTVRVKKILVSGFSTSAGSELLALVRASTEGTGGTKAALTGGAMDPAHTAAATAVVNTFTTAAQSAGTAVATLAAGNVMTTAAAGNGGNVLDLLGGDVIVLRGTSDFLELQNKNGGNLAAGTVLALTIVTEEDAS